MTIQINTNKTLTAYHWANDGECMCCLGGFKAPLGAEAKVLEHVFTWIFAAELALRAHATRLTKQGQRMAHEEYYDLNESKI